MLPDPWTLALVAVVVLGAPEPPTDASAAPPAESPAAEAPAPAVPAPEAPPAEVPPAPTDPSAPAPAEGAPGEAVGTFPDAAGAAPAPAAEPAPAPTEPRTWNDPTAATAAAAATPSAAPATSTEDELGDEPLEPVKGKDPKGFGMAMVGAITISPASGHAWASGGCPVANVNGTVYAPGCAATPAVGVSAEGRFGYMWGLFGAELYGQIAGDYVNASLNPPPNVPGLPSYVTQMHLGRFGIGGGGMARLKTPPGSFRLSTGAGVGFLYRTIFSNVSSLDGSFQDYVAPVLRADVGVVMVSVLTLGIMGWVEFAPTVTIAPDLTAAGPAADELEMVLGNTVAYSGTQAFIGVFGGFAFGK